jgi:membrane protease YdiL (CAAX protease family)
MNQLLSQSLSARVARRPILSFVVPVIAFTWTVQFTFLLLELPVFPVAMVAELLALLGWATALSALTGGRAGVRRLFAGLTRWRFSPGWYALLLLGMPAATLLVAAATGTLRSPGSGWAAEAGQFLFVAVVFGALLGNVWEETAWLGFVQRRLRDEGSRGRAALLTAIPFALIHLPLAFEAHGLRGTSAGSLALDWALLIGSAPCFRYLVGLVDDRTGSLLAAGLLHGAFNASSALGFVAGGWQYLPAMALLTVAVTVGVTVAARAGVAVARRRDGGRIEEIATA